MKAPRVVFSDLAVADILAQADWYELQSDRRLAKRWERAVTSSLLRLVKTPRAGALCGFKADALRATRRLPVTGFSAHLIFYKVSGNQIHVLRVVHGARDLDRLFSE
ncbi:MAG: type II toxin-antitoxin system RelE/ParE family toxin [Candidatus Korobacteraceae bacterium]